MTIGYQSLSADLEPNDDHDDGCEGDRPFVLAAEFSTMAGIDNDRRLFLKGTPCRGCGIGDIDVNVDAYQELFCKPRFAPPMDFDPRTDVSALVRPTPFATGQAYPQRRPWTPTTSPAIAPMSTVDGMFNIVSPTDEAPLKDVASWADGAAKSAADAMGKTEAPIVAPSPGLVQALPAAVLAKAEEVADGGFVGGPIGEKAKEAEAQVLLDAQKSVALEAEAAKTPDPRDRAQLENAAGEAKARVLINRARVERFRVASALLVSSEVRKIEADRQGRMAAVTSGPARERHRGLAKANARLATDSKGTAKNLLTTPLDVPGLADQVAAMQEPTDTAAAIFTSARPNVYLGRPQGNVPMHQAVQARVTGVPSFAVPFLQQHRYGQRGPVTALQGLGEVSESPRISRLAYQGKVAAANVIAGASRHGAGNLIQSSAGMLASLKHRRMAGLAGLGDLGAMTAAQRAAAFWPAGTKFAPYAQGKDPNVYVPLSELAIKDFQMVGSPYGDGGPIGEEQIRQDYYIRLVRGAPGGVYISFAHASGSNVYYVTVNKPTGTIPGSRRMSRKANAQATKSVFQREIPNSTWVKVTFPSHWMPIVVQPDKTVGLPRVGFNDAANVAARKRYGWVVGQPGTPGWQVMVEQGRALVEEQIRATTVQQEVWAEEAKKTGKGPSVPGAEEGEFPWGYVAAGVGALAVVGGALYWRSRQGGLSGVPSLKQALATIRRYSKKAALARLKGNIPKAMADERFVDGLVQSLERIGAGSQAMKAEEAGQQAASRQYKSRR